MSYYMLENNIRQNLGIFLQKVIITGESAKNMIEVSAALNNKEKYPYIELRDELVSFISESLNKLAIQGQYALVMVQIQAALARKLDSIPVDVISDKKAKTKKVTKSNASTDM